MASEPRTIILTDDSLIDREIIQWADLDDLAEQYPELFERINLVSDVVEHCSSAHVFKSIYDFDLPGRSGVEYRIETARESDLVQEIRDRLRELIDSATNSGSPTRPAAEGGRRTASDIAVLLLALADRLQSIRAPAGYQGIAMSAVRKIRKAAEDLRAGNQSKDFLIERLMALKTELGKGSGASDVDALIRSLQTYSKL
jgi:hypothetical protein